MEEESSSVAAIKIQCAYRQKLARKLVDQKKEEKKVQFSATVEHELQEASALAIQRKARERYAKQKQRPPTPGPKEIAAATKIQCKVRQHQASKLVEAKKLEKKMAFARSTEEELEHASAIAIQRRARQKYGKSEPVKPKAVTFDIPETEETVAAATKIQCATRQRQARKYVEQKKNEKYHKFVAEVEHELEEASALIIQKRAREKYGKSKVSEVELASAPSQAEQDAALKIQCRVRQHQAVRFVAKKKIEKKSAFAAATERELETASAIAIQRKAREKYSKPKPPPTAEEQAAALKIQCNVRQHQARKFVQAKKDEKKQAFALETERELETASAIAIQRRAKERYGKNTPSPKSDSTSPIQGRTSLIKNPLGRKDTMNSTTSSLQRHVSISSMTSSIGGPLPRKHSKADSVISTSTSASSPGLFHQASMMTMGSFSQFGSLREAFAIQSAAEFSDYVPSPTSIVSRRHPDLVSKFTGGEELGKEEAYGLLSDIAAVVLQCAGRKYIAKGRVDHLRKTRSDNFNKEVEDSLMEVSAIRIQTQERRRQALRKMETEDPVRGKALERARASTVERQAADRAALEAYMKRLVQTASQILVRKDTLDSTTEGLSRDVSMAVSDTSSKGMNKTSQNGSSFSSSGGLMQQASLMAMQSLSNFGSSLREAFALQSTADFSADFIPSPDGIIARRHPELVEKFVNGSEIQDAEAYGLLSDIAAVVLQCAIRKYIAKTTVATLSMERKESFAREVQQSLLEVSAITIQATERRRQATKRRDSLEQERKNGSTKSTSSDVEKKSTAQSSPSPSPEVMTAPSAIPHPEVEGDTPWTALGAGERPQTVVYSFRSKSRGYALATIFSNTMIQAMGKETAEARNQSFIGLQCLHGAAMALKSENRMYLPRLPDSHWIVSRPSVNELLTSPSKLGSKGRPVLSSAKVATSIQYHQAKALLEEPMCRVSRTLSTGKQTVLPPIRSFSSGKIARLDGAGINEVVNATLSELNEISRRSKARVKSCEQLKMIKSDSGSGVVPAELTSEFLLTPSPALSEHRDRKYAETEDHRVKNDEEVWKDEELAFGIVHRHPLGLSTAVKQEKQKLIAKLKEKEAEKEAEHAKAEVSKSSSPAKRRIVKVKGRTVEVKPFVSADPSQGEFTEEQQQQLKSRYLKNIVDNYENAKGKKPPMRL